MTRFMFESFSGPDMYVAIPIGADDMHLECVYILGNDGVVHRKDATRFAKRVMKSVAKAINDAAVACSRGVAASRLF